MEITVLTELKMDLNMHVMYQNFFSMSGIKMTIWVQKT